jgi:transcriptional regulator with XRE-family HTH domain
LATIRLRTEQLERLRRVSRTVGGHLLTDKELAERIGIHPSNLHRVLTEKAAPGTKFIAGLLDVYGIEWFSDLFEILPDDEEVTK